MACEKFRRRYRLDGTGSALLFFNESLAIAGVSKYFNGAQRTASTSLPPEPFSSNTLLAQHYKMNFNDDAEMAKCIGLDGVIRVKNRLSQLRSELEARNERASISRIFDGLCSSHDELSRLPTAVGGRPIASDSAINLRMSIDELLDQLACINSQSRLWAVKALIIVEQLQEFANERDSRLRALPNGLSLDSRIPQSPADESKPVAPLYRVAA